MRNSWRLVTDLTLFLQGTTEMWIVPSDSRIAKNNVKKELAGQQFKEVEFENEEFTLTIGRDLKAYVEFQDSSWHVVNFASSALGILISQCKNDCGKFEEKFEAVFSDDEPGAVFFVSQNMKEYDDCFDEMTRRINCQLLKKTKKWQVGHRYDSEKETMYYLGKYESTKTDEFGSMFEPGTLHLVAKNIKGCKTIEDVFREKELFALTSLPSMVDSGQSLEVGDFDYSEKRDDLFLRALEKNTKKGDFIEYENIKSILDVLCYGAGNPRQEVIDGLQDIVANSMRTLIIEYYGLEAGVPQNMILSKKKSLEDNVKALEELFYESIPDANIFKAAYYQEFFKHFNINVPDIAKGIIDGYDEKLLFSDFDSYRTCGKYYFKRHDIDKVVLKSNQREKSYTGYPRGGSSTKTVTVESLFGKDTELTQAILDLTNEAVLSFGAGVSGFKISNMGTKKSPNEYVYVLITLDDLIKALPEMPQTLKDEIITNKFQRIEIEFDKDKVVK